MDHLLTTTALVIILTIGTAWGQAPPKKQPASDAGAAGDVSQLVPAAKAPFIMFPPNEPTKETAAVGSGEGTTTPRDGVATSAPSTPKGENLTSAPSVPKDDTKKKMARKPNPKPRERQAPGDTTADLNRQELSRITSGYYQGY